MNLQRSLLAMLALSVLAAPKPSLADISDRGVQEHAKPEPRSIDSAYQGTWGDNRNSGTSLVTGFERRVFAGQSDYLSWTEEGSPPVSGILTNGSAELPNGLVVALSPRGAGTSTVVAFNSDGSVAWRSEEYSFPEDNGIAPASSAGIQSPMVDQEGNIYLADNYGIWSYTQDGDLRWFSRFLDYSDSRLGSGQDLRLIKEGYVGTVMASGWHIWLHKDTGEPAVIKEPDPFSAPECDPRSRLFLTVNGGELDQTGELEEIVCIAFDSNQSTPQNNNVAVRPPIPGKSEFSRYFFTYPGPVGNPDIARIIAWDFTCEVEGSDGTCEQHGLEKAWEFPVGLETAASPTLTPDYSVIGASDAERNLNLIDAETGENVTEGPTEVPFNSFGSPGNTIDGWFCDLFDPQCILPDGTFAVKYDTEPLAEIAEQVLPILPPIPMFSSGRPDAELIGGALADPMRYNFTAFAGYDWALGPVLGELLRLGTLTPAAVFPISYDLRTGELKEGQNFGPELSQFGTSEANGMITTTGRYVVQKAELLTLFVYYLFQDNLPFPLPPEALPPGTPPIPPGGIVPPPYQVQQPVGGLMIYEPESFEEGTMNQIEMDIFHTNFALDNLCFEADCDLEEAAARLGYAAWNLDKSVQLQIREAFDRGEVSNKKRRLVSLGAAIAAKSCRAARRQLLRDQPEDPTRREVKKARLLTKACRAVLEGVQQL